MMDLVIFVASIFFFGFVFDLVSRMHGRLERQNRELLALHHAALDISGDLSLDSVLQKIVDQACQLAQTRYGAIAVIAGSGDILEFVTSGVSAEQRDKIGPPPQGHGLLGVSLHDLQRRFDESCSKVCAETGAEPPYSTNVEIVFRCAKDFARSVHHDFLSDGHLVAALVEVDSQVSAFLKSHGLSAAAIRWEFLNLLGHGIVG